MKISRNIPSRVFFEPAGERRFAPLLSPREIDAPSPVIATGAAAKRELALITIEGVTQQLEGALGLELDRARIGSRLMQLAKQFRDLPAAFAQCSVDDPEDRDRFRRFVLAARTLDARVARVADQLGLGAELSAYWDALEAAVDSMPIARAVDQLAEGDLPKLAVSLQHRGLTDAAAKLWSAIATTLIDETAEQRAADLLTKKAPPTTEQLIAKGSAFLPPDLRAFVAEAKAAMKAAVAARDTDRARETFELHAKNIAVLTEKMASLRHNLIEGSSVSHTEAAHLAESIIFGAGIDRGDVPPSRGHRSQHATPISGVNHSERESGVPSLPLSVSGVTHSEREGGVAVRDDSEHLGGLRSALAELIRMTEGRGLATLERIVRVEERAHARGALIDLGPEQDDGAGLYHEFGHHLGRAHEEATLAWLKSRATDPKIRPLQKIDPDGEYADDERGYEDHFQRPYVGRIYDDGGDEVMSTGLEMFADPGLMARLLIADEEHFALTLGGLRA